MGSPIYLSLIASILGATCLFLFGRAVITSTDHNSLLLISYTSALLITAPFISIAKIRGKITPKERASWRFALLSGCSLYFATLSFTVAIDHGAEVGVASFFFQSGFIITSAYSALFLGEKVTRNKILGWIFTSLAIGFLVIK